MQEITIKIKWSDKKLKKLSRVENIQWILQKSCGDMGIRVEKIQVDKQDLTIKENIKQKNTDKLPINNNETAENAGKKNNSEDSRYCDEADNCDNDIPNSIIWW